MNICLQACNPDNKRYPEGNNGYEVKPVEAMS
jgi:hypothetical protein